MEIQINNMKKKTEELKQMFKNSGLPTS